MKVPVLASVATVVALAALRVAAGQQPVTSVDAVLQQYDRNGDGKISRDEAPERMGRQFDRHDRDGDGFLDREELGALPRFQGRTQRAGRGGKAPAPDAGRNGKTGLIHNDPGSFPGYTLFAPIGSTTTYLIDNAGKVVHTRESDYRPGQSVYLLENGNLLRMGSLGPRGNATFHGGGSGGVVEEFDWDGNLVCEFLYSTDEHLLHHDIERLPNGNTLICSGAKGRLFQVTPTGRIVWEYLWAGQDDQPGPALPFAGPPGFSPRFSQTWLVRAQRNQRLCCGRLLRGSAPPLGDGRVSRS